MDEVILLVGPTGSGKSSIREVLEEDHGFKEYEVSDYSKEIYRQLGTRKDISEFGDMMIDYVGSHWPAQTVYEDLDHSCEKAVISGVRVPGFIDYFSERCENVKTVLVNANPETRMERKMQDGYSLEEFAERDRREAEWWWPTIYLNKQYDKLVETDSITAEEAAEKVVS